MINSWDEANQTGPIVSVERLCRWPANETPLLVDTRPFGQYQAAHIPGAMHSDQNLLRIPDSSPESIARYVEAATIEVRRLGVRKDQWVIFYEETTGALAPRGVWMLDFLGIPGGAMLDGGLVGWIASGGPVTSGIEVAGPSDVSIDVNPDVLATVPDILASLENGNRHRIVDTRSDLEFLSATIPTSHQLEWLRTLDGDGKLRPRDEVEQMYASLGLSAESPETIVTFCGSGYRAAHTYVLLKALGFPRVKNYVPSWGEWGRRSDLPIERPRRS